MFGGNEVSDNGPNDIIALINLRGVIADASSGGGPFGSKGGISFQGTRHLIEQAFALPKVLAVILVINSPGGSPTQTNLIGSMVREKAEETQIPVYAIVEDVAASGGYWLACSADEIYIDPNSMVGSIGVIFQNVGVNGTMKKIGMEPRIITSGKNKAGLNPFLEYDKAQAEIVIQNMMIIHSNFKGWVKERRPKVKDEGDIFSGRVFVGKEAQDLGLVDGVGNLSEVLKMKFPDRDDLKLIEVKKKMDGNLLGLLGPLFQRSSKVLDQISETLDQIQLPSQGQFYA